jgi:hypothetical protein
LLTRSQKHILPKGRDVDEEVREGGGKRGRERERGRGGGGKRGREGRRKDTAAGAVRILEITKSTVAFAIDLDTPEIRGLIPDKVVAK